MKTLLHSNRGMALLLTLLIISILFALTVQFNRAMRNSLQGATIMGDAVANSHLARSAFNFGCAVLAADGEATEYDSLREIWTAPELLADYFAEAFAAGRGTEISILDHSARIQLNSLLVEKDGGLQINPATMALLARFLRSEEFGLDEEEADNIVAAIIDWLDEDDEVTGFGGAENDFYLDQEQGYPCKNGPLESLEELLLIRWMSRDLLYGTEEKPGILNYLTYLGNDGKINVNTAEPLVLRALAESLDREMVDYMVQYRGDEDNDLAEPEWYRQVPGLPGDIEIYPGLLTTSSTYFEIVTESKAGNVTKKGAGVLRRQGEKNKILSWRLM